MIHNRIKISLANRTIMLKLYTTALICFLKNDNFLYLLSSMPLKK